MDKTGDLIKTICVGTNAAKDSAINELDREVRSRLRRTAMGMFRMSYEGADELAQDTMIRVIKAACSFTGTGGGWGWICTIAQRLFLSEKRRSQRQPIMEPFPEDDDGVQLIPEPNDRLEEESARDEAMAALLEDAMAILAEEDSVKAIALYEYTIGNWKTEDLAAFTGSKAPYQYVFAAREKLRRICARLMRDGALG